MHHTERHLEPVFGQPCDICSLEAEQVLDSRGWPTVHIRLGCSDGIVVEGSAPAGASTGRHEAVELRDGGDAWSGRGVRRAVAAVRDEIGPLLTERLWPDLRALDDALVALDGTPDLRRLGANAAVAVSIAAARAFAHHDDVPLHRWIARRAGTVELLPVPHFNVLNGGAHAANDLAFQEFMVAPVGAADEDEAVRVGAEVYHALAERVRSRYGSTGLGDEGGFAPPISRPEDALDLLVGAITDAGHTPGTDAVAIAIDPAANGFSDGDGGYRIAGRSLSREELVDLYARLVADYPIRLIEDGFAEDDPHGWLMLADRIGGRVELVGDDLYVTDAARVRDGAARGLSDAALVKPNQAGTVSRTLDALAAARDCGMAAMVSHRSGETVDTFIADLAVGSGVGRIKSGAPARGERVAKYNRLTEIEAREPGLPFGLRPGST